MKNFKKIHLFRKLLFLSFFVLLAKSANGLNHVCDTLNLKEFKLLYSANNKRINSYYLNNAKSIKELKRFLNTNTSIDKISVLSYSSPEGSFYKNLLLSNERGNSAKEFLLEILDNDTILNFSIEIDSRGENWSGLYEKVFKSYNMSDRADVLSVLNSSISSVEKKAKLKGLSNGNTWMYFIDNYMPELRYAEIICSSNSFFCRQPLLPIVKSNIYEPVSTLLEGQNLSLPIEEKYDTKTLLALKTNLLYDALTLLNISLEIPIYKNKFSVLYQHQFPWYRWGEERNEYCVRYLSMCGEIRWWFKPQPKLENGRFIKRDKFVGHYLGVYGMGGKWDFEWKRNICYQGEFWSAGLSYGFSKPIGKKINLEFMLSVGYASIPYRHFTPTEDYSILLRDPNKHGTWKYFGPTKAEISLVVPIIIKYKKGGEYGKVR